MIPAKIILLRLAIAGLLGAAIGVERQIRRRPAGMRTSFFVCMGSALFTILSFELAHRYGDTSSTRIASNLVQGIGFLGAGAILREAGSVVGLTTAATIFVEAAIGMAIGGGFYGAAAFTVGLALFALVVMGWLADWLNLRRTIVNFRFTTSHAENIVKELQQCLAELNVPMKQFRVSMAGTDSIVEFEAEVSHHQQAAIQAHFNRPGIVSEVVMAEGHRE